MVATCWISTCIATSGLLMVAATAAAGSNPPPLQGAWAGDRMQLVIDAQGGRVETDCASGRFAGPVTATADGRFTAQGSFSVHQPGPQRADGTGPAAASYSGELASGGGLKLSITPDGAPQAQVYALQSGARIKLLKCL